MRFEMWKSKAQKGAFLVFTALMIPIIFICAGFAVDLGNAWAYKSKLQNAADAAALAGAKEYGDNGTETVDKHDDADAQAERFLIANLGNDYFKTHLAEGSTGKVRYQMKPLTQNDSTKTYYRVYLSAKTDTTFMQMFNYKHMDVGVEAVAVVPQMKQESNFDALFVARNNFMGNINSNQHGNAPNPISTSYTGHIYVADENKYNYYRANNDQDGRYKFFKPEAYDKHFNQVKDDKSLYEEVQLLKNSNYDEAALNTKKYLQGIADQNKIIKSDSLTFYWNPSKIPMSSGEDYDYYYIDTNQSNVDFSLDYFYAKSPADEDKPVYIFIEGQKDQIQINLVGDKNDTAIHRPVILCYLGTSPYYSNEWGGYYTNPLKIAGNGHKFRGTIFAPNAYVYLNFDSPGNEIHGSVFSAAIELPTNHGRFYFEDHHVIQGFTGGSGGGQTGSSTELKLVISGKEGLTWSDD